MKSYELADEIIEDIRDRWALRPNIAEREIAHEAQKKLLEYQEKIAVHILDPYDKPIIIFTEEFWQSLLKAFGIKDA